MPAQIQPDPNPNPNPNPNPLGGWRSAGVVARFRRVFEWRFFCINPGGRKASLDQSDSSGVAQVDLPGGVVHSASCISEGTRGIGLP